MKLVLLNRLIFILFISIIVNYIIAQKSTVKKNKNSLSLIIKDSGVVELVRNDVAMILYISVTNTGQNSLHLSLVVKKCCYKPKSPDEDCESMQPIGGDMGELIPKDTRNLTAIYPTMYLHDREGSCEMEIVSQDGSTMSHELYFNTTLPRKNARITKLLENYFDPSELQTCKSEDQDPIGFCNPAACLLKYTGARNFFNYVTQTCEKLPKCISKNKLITDTAYVPELNKCFDLKSKMTDEELSSFESGKPSIPSLIYLNRYPMNIRCHHGTLKEGSNNCDCNKGWESSPFDPTSFNFDVQVYHMCTVWTGELGAQEAANITVFSTQDQMLIPTIIFITLGMCFIAVATVLVIVYCIQQRRVNLIEKEIEENVPLIQQPAKQSG